MINAAGSSKADLFIDHLSPYFLEAGYVLKKSTKQFVKPFDKGNIIVSILFQQKPDGLEASLMWGIAFSALEKQFVTLKNFKNKVDTGYSVGIGLNYLPAVRDSGKVFRFILPDTETGDSKESQIRKMAEEMIEAFKAYGIPFLEKYKDMEEVEAELNNLPVAYSPLTNWDDKHIFFGLLLARYYSPEDYPLIEQSYIEYINTIKAEERSERKAFLLRVRRFLADL